MANNELEKICAELKEWEKLQKEADDMVKELQGRLKDEMVRRGTEEMVLGKYIVRWTTFLKTGFDQSAFKVEHADLFNLFQKKTTARKFTVSC